MSGKKNSDKKEQSSIPLNIINALSDLDPEYLIRYESYPFYPSENFNISQILEDSKKKEKEEDEDEKKVGNYMIKKTLGKGTFGEVKLGIYIPTQEKVAIKILEKSKIIEKDDEIRVKREFEMLTLFSHPNVILVAEIFESGGSFYSVMEYCEGGELFNYIVKNRRLSQNEAAFFYYQLINGLEYIHSLGIVHRDLKPENLLLTKDHLLKIIDFGLSNYFKKGQKDLLVTPCGSPCYASPEMVAGKKYNGFKIDIWSTGIILYAMLCGYLPFEDKDNDALFEKILECKLVFPKYISKIGKNLIEKILVTEPNKRITIKEIKEHPFYLKGKEIFEQEFSICQIENDMKEMNNDSDINNIMNLHILNDDNDSISNEKKENKDEKKIIKNEKEMIIKSGNEKKKQVQKNRLIINNLEKENLILRINTEGEGEKQILTLREKYLPNLERDIDGCLEKRNNHSSKKLINKNNKNKNKNKNINKGKNGAGPFKKRKIIYFKNNYNNTNLYTKEEKIEEKERDKIKKKLIKTNKYNDIKQIKKKHIIGKSVDVRKMNYKNKNKNFILHKINYTNVIKTKFNSKEKFNKNNNIKKENIYSNNINSIIHNKQNKKLKLKFNDGQYNIIEKSNRTANSTDKKNIKLTSFQTIDREKNTNYLENLVNIHSNIKKYKQQLKDFKLNDIKINDETKIKLKNNMDNSLFEENKTHHKINTDILSVEKKLNIKMEKEKIGKNKNKMNIKNNLINIIDNTDEDEINQNKLEQINNINTDRHFNRINKIFHEKIMNPKTIRETVAKRKIKNLKYYMNEIEQNHTLRKEKKNKSKNKNGLNIDLFNSFELKKNSNFNLKKQLINDFNKKIKKNKKENILILENLINDNNNLNTIDIINKTEPNQTTLIKNKISNKSKNIDIKLSIEKNYAKKIITKKISINKNRNIDLDSNNFIKKQKINFNVNKINNHSNYEKNFNRTSNDFNYLNYSIVNQINSKYKNVFDLNLGQNKRDSNNNNEKNFINGIRNDKNIKKNISNINKNPSVTIKNTVINLNIDTGIIIHPFDKRDKIKQINSNKVQNYLTNKNHDNLDKYEQSISKNNNIKKGKKIANMSHHNTNENPFQNIDTNDNLLTLINDTNNICKKIKKKIIIFKDKNDVNMNNLKRTNNKILNQSMNNNIKKHMKYNSMKLEENLRNKINKKKEKNIFLQTNENFFGMNLNKI